MYKNVTIIGRQLNLHNQGIIKLSFQKYKLSISFSEMKSSHFDDDIPLPPHTNRFPHTEVWVPEYLSLLPLFKRFVNS